MLTSLNCDNLISNYYRKQLPLMNCLLKYYWHHFWPMIFWFESSLKEKPNGTKFFSIGLPILILLIIVYLKLWRHNKDSLIEKTYKKGVFGILISNFWLIFSKIPVNVRYYYTKIFLGYFFLTEGELIISGKNTSLLYYWLLVMTLQFQVKNAL